MTNLEKANQVSGSPPKLPVGGDGGRTEGEALVGRCVGPSSLEMQQLRPDQDGPTNSSDMDIPMVSRLASPVAGHMAVLLGSLQEALWQGTPWAPWGWLSELAGRPVPVGTVQTPDTS